MAIEVNCAHETKQYSTVGKSDVLRQRLTGLVCLVNIYSIGSNLMTVMSWATSVPYGQQ
jgi:hypothetical protein